MAGSLSKPLRLLLVASLALNLFVAGAIGTEAIVGGNWLGDLLGIGHGRPRIMGMPNPRQLRAALPADDEVVLKAIMERQRPIFRERLRAMFAARQATAEAIMAEPFDRARVEAAFAALREREAAVAVVAQETILDLVTQLDADSRSRISDLLTTHRERRN